MAGVREAQLPIDALRPSPSLLMAGEASGMSGVVNQLMDQVHVKCWSPLEQREQKSLIECQCIQAEEPEHHEPCNRPEIHPIQYTCVKHGRPPISRLFTFVRSHRLSGQPSTRLTPTVLENQAIKLHS
jgi:hypothetical protein